MRQHTAMIALAGTLTMAGSALAPSGALKAVLPGTEVPAATFSATLTGASEVPPADADGTGSFTARLNAKHDQLCYELKADKIDTATAAHVHAGAAGVNGPPVVMLDAPVNGTAVKCAAVTMDVAMKLMDQPQNYYVNVHNAAYPGGAIRGQLAKAP